MTKTAAARPSSYHHGDLRAALRGEAERILVSRGAAEVSLREVARAVGVSHAAPYRHYPSREALLADIAAGGFVRLQAGLEALPARRDPAKRFAEMARAYVAFALAEPAVYRLMFGPEIRKADHPQLAEAGFQALGVLRAALVALGCAAPATAETMAAWGMAHGIAQLLIDRRLEPDPAVDEAVELPRLVARAAQIFVDGLQARC